MQHGITLVILCVPTTSDVHHGFSARLVQKLLEHYAAQ